MPSSSATVAGLTSKSPKEKRKHKCGVCVEVFASAQALAIHRYRHTNVKPFQCPKCPESFIFQHIMEKHVFQVHELVKPFVCELCGKRFGQTHNRRIHMKFIHPKEVAEEAKISPGSSGQFQPNQGSMPGCSHSAQRSPKGKPRVGASKQRQLFKPTEGSISSGISEVKRPFALEATSRESLSRNIASNPVRRSKYRFFIKRPRVVPLPPEVTMRLVDQIVQYSCGWCDRKFSYRVDAMKHYRKKTCLLKGDEKPSP